ncbi:hypothetical protein BDV93DRAFT_524647 [Ceratobasidium sp. AG-I]|nr:hypothetical protein BDV93DRAFT_524647 [Ceratobasidium sp. AG-I]
MSDSAQAPVSTTEASHKIIVHHLNKSRSQRILWLLEELDIPYEIKKYQRTPELLAPKELKAPTRIWFVCLLSPIYSHLSKIPGKFFAGGDEPTAADFLMHLSLEAFALRATSTMGEETKKFMEHVSARPAYQRALEKGRKYDNA